MSDSFDVYRLSQRQRSFLAYFPSAQFDTNSLTRPRHACACAAHFGVTPSRCPRCVPVLSLWPVGATCSIYLTVSTSHSICLSPCGCGCGRCRLAGNSDKTAADTTVHRLCGECAEQSEDLVMLAHTRLIEASVAHKAVFKSCLRCTAEVHESHRLADLCVNSACSTLYARAKSKLEVEVQTTALHKIEACLAALPHP